MAVPFNRAVISSRLVGRAAELELLRATVGAAAGGRGQTVLIAGEAGIGKSRLVSEVQAQAERLGFLCLEGHCFEPDHVLPYAPLLDLLRARFTGRPAAELARELGPAASELVKLLPELSSLLPDLAPTVSLEPEQEKRRLFQALVQFLAGLAAERPVLVAIEDVHWSDDASLELLLHLGRRLAPHPILLLLTYRSEEIRPGLSHFLAELDRGRLATELALSRLELADVDAMLRAIFTLDRPVRADFLHALLTLTEGNPFFIEEVLKSLITAGEIYHVAGRWGRKEIGELAIPRSVQDAVRRRSALLSEAAREVLALAAVAGRRFNFALLQALMGREEDDLLVLLKELISAQLIVEVSAEQFAFRHALTRQAVSGELLARERLALHRQIAAALERLYADALDSHLEDLAYHFHAGGEWAKALAYAERAGSRALALYAPRAAVEQFSRAIEAARQLSVAPRAALHRGRGLAHETLGDFEPAQDDLETALALARDTGDRMAEWQTLLDLGVLWASRDYTHAGTSYQQALTVARTMDDAAILGHSLNRLGNWHVNVEQQAAGQRHHEEALAIFRGLGDRRGVAQTLDLLGLAHLERGDALQCAAYYREAIALSRDLGDRQGLVSSLAVLASRGVSYVIDLSVVEETTLAEGGRDADAAVALAREIGWRAGEAYAACVVGGCLATLGDFGPALGNLQVGLAIAEEIEHRQWMAAAHTVFGALYLDLLALPAAKVHLEQALALARETGSQIWIRFAAGLLARCLVHDDRSMAERLLNEALGPDAPGQTISQRLCWLARVEVLLGYGEPEAALALTDRLIVSTPHAEDDRVVPRLWQLRAQALIGLRQTSAAEAVLLAAADVAAAQGRKPLLWQLQRTLGDLRRGQGRRDDADRAFSAARAVVNELAAGIPDEELRDGFLNQAAALLPRTAHTPRQAAKLAFGGLTAREREVATLIAQGSSNRAIAEELVVSERTVEGHVANILAKLEFAARTQIAAWAVETGLARSGESFQPVATSPRSD